MAFDISKPVVSSNPIPSSGKVTVRFDIIDPPNGEIEILYHLSESNKVFFVSGGLRLKELRATWSGTSPVSKAVTIEDQSGTQVAASLWVEVTHTESDRARAKQTQIRFS